MNGFSKLVNFHLTPAAAAFNVTVQFLLVLGTRQVSSAWASGRSQLGRRSRAEINFFFTDRCHGLIRLTESEYRDCWAPLGGRGKMKFGESGNQWDTRLHRRVAGGDGVSPTRMSRAQYGPAGKLPDDAPASGWRTRRDGPGLRTEPAEGRRRSRRGRGDAARGCSRSGSPGL